MPQFTNMSVAPVTDNATLEKQPSALKRFAQGFGKNLGKAAISLGTGIPAIELDRMVAQNRTIDLQNSAIEQDIQAQDDQAQRQLRQQQLATAAFSGGPDEDKALRQLMVEFPEFAKEAFDNIGAVEQHQREEAARDASKALALPFPERRKFLLERATSLESQGRDATETLQLATLDEESQNRELRILEAAALSTQERLAQREGDDVPADQQSFEALIENMSPEDQKKARRIKAGLDPRAGQSAQERIALDKELQDLVAASEANIAESKSFAQTTGTDRAKRIDSGFEQITKIDANIRNLDQAIAAIDDGAASGAVVSRFTPTIRESTVALEQIQAQLGLDVVQAVQFGALSEGELQLALATALPTGLKPPELKQWIQDRKASQEKLRDYISEQIQFLDEGGTVAGFLRKKERELSGGNDGSDTPSSAEPQVINFSELPP